MKRSKCQEVLFSFRLFCAGATAGFGQLRFLAAFAIGASIASAQTYTFTTLAGQAGQRGGGDGAAGSARFAAPSGLALDEAGNLYVADTGNHTIRKITPAGVVSTLAGLAGQSGAVDGMGGTARFNGPTAVTVDLLGNVYVADLGNALIRQVTATGLVFTLPLASLERPSGIALDSAGNGYVADRNLRIVGKTSPLGVQDVLAGSPGRLGDVDGVGGAARFRDPLGLTVNGAGTVFLIDGVNFTIRRIAADATVTTLAGAALQSGSSDGPGSAARFDFRASVGIAADGTGGVYVADDGNHVIRRVTAAGVVGTVAGLAGSRGSSDGTASTARFNAPAGLALDRAGSIYVADTANHTIRVGRVATANAYPIIAASPRSVVVNPAATVALTVAATGDAPLAWQWLKNGAPVAGATDAQLIISGATAADAGIYSVVATNSAGVFTSGPASVTIGGSEASRISNLSVRTNLAAGQTLIVGLATSGPKSMLVRAVGSGLEAFGVAAFHPDPAIGLFDAASARIDGNDNWDGSLSPLFDRLGAFRLPAGSSDAALQRSITGANTAQISGAGAGVVLVEAYDAAGAATTRLVNVSTRSAVGSGESILIAGFFIEGAAARTVLIRGIGPRLADFGVSGWLADPKLEVFDSTGRKIAENDNWSGALASVFARVGAFALLPASRDSGLIITLPPQEGYTVQLSGVNGGTGEALLEIYEVP